MLQGIVDFLKDFPLMENPFPILPQIKERFMSSNNYLKQLKSQFD
jgi:hypothetical protein